LIISRTGWTFRYLDGLCLKRGMELLEFFRREAEAQAKANEKARGGKGESVQIGTSEPAWQPLDEAAAESQFAMAQLMVPPSVLGRSTIPEHLRDAIRWAEAEKEKRGLN